ncbi:hypothetical protein H7347_06505 [Corynebacterium sp. zg-331]|uniref:hypothetical protein n=1 Tax=unclassified Corynebacterium TaxID=2624378 RepID=UPI00128CF789|nr:MULTISPECIES: hypothetical protein [unclassified Corynebacterium]MBC3186226.1 hypothetical protein [Corynebacterium sp. zg-331]MPV52713.1 hypothetical protein [Corynebacterium sp. zg331]
MLSTLLSSALSGLLALNPFLAPADHIPNIASGSSSTDAAATAPSQDNARPTFIHGGQLAVKRAVFQEEQAAGHKLVTVTFTGDHSATIQQDEAFDPEADAAALDRIIKVLKLNGYEKISMLAAPLVAQ